MNLIFRNATPGDFNEIIEIYNSTISSRMVTADLEPVTMESRQAWFAEHNAHKRPLWVVENEHQQVIGWVSFQSFYGRPAYEATVEISIYLKTMYRGQGLGKQILQYAIDHAPRFGVKTLLGFIFSHNLPSLQLFYRLGFQDWGILPDVAVLEGIERGLKIVGKRIA